MPEMLRSFFRPLVPFVVRPGATSSVRSLLPKRRCWGRMEVINLASQKRPRHRKQMKIPSILCILTSSAKKKKKTIGRWSPKFQAITCATHLHGHTSLVKSRIRWLDQSAQRSSLRLPAGVLQGALPDDLVGLHREGSNVPSLPNIPSEVLLQRFWRKN